jgi:hypothetical protein
VKARQLTHHSNDHLASIVNSSHLESKRGQLMATTDEFVWNGTAHFKKHKQLFECQHLLLL